VPRVRVEAVGLAHHALRPFGRDEIALLERVEKRILGPARIGEARILRVRLRDRRRLFAGEPFHRVRPHIEIRLHQARLRFQRALRIGQPIFRDLAERLDGVGDLLGDFVGELAFFARLQIRGERTAAFLDQTAEVFGERLRIGRTDFSGSGI
jgi:hypothetical protein